VVLIPTKPPVVVVIIVPPVPTLSIPVVVIPETLNCVIEPMPPMTDVDTPALVAKVAIPALSA